MKINDSMFHSMIEKNEKFQIINDDFVLLLKKMPCTDENLEHYISSLNKLKDEGVNIANIVDYRLIKGTTVSFINGDNYTSGVFLETKAKGNCNAITEHIRLRTDKEYDLNLIEYMYDKMLNFYLNELEKRANASQEIYDKLVNDYTSFNKYGLEPDPKPLNFFFDKDIGYTFIDVILTKNKEVDLNFFTRYILIIIFGYGIPRLYIDGKNLNIIPSNAKIKLDSIFSLLENKITKSLIKKGVNRELIIKTINDYKESINNLEVVEENISYYISMKFNNKINKL